MTFTSEAKHRIIEDTVKYLDSHPDATVADALQYAMLAEQDRLVQEAIATALTATIEERQQRQRPKRGNGPCQ